MQINRRFVFGTAEDCDYKLIDAYASSHHAAVTVIDSYGAATIEDLGSTNGTWVGLEKMRVIGPYRLKPGSRITMGRTVLLWGEQLFNTLMNGKNAPQPTVPESRKSRVQQAAEYKQLPVWAEEGGMVYHTTNDHIRFNFRYVTTDWAPVHTGEKCMAHGNKDCYQCSLHPSNCLMFNRRNSVHYPYGCESYADTGMHWDSCGNRINTTAKAAAFLAWELDQFVPQGAAWVYDNKRVGHLMWAHPFGEDGSFHGGKNAVAYHIGPAHTRLAGLFKGQQCFTRLQMAAALYARRTYVCPPWAINLRTPQDDWGWPGTSPKAVASYEEED